MAEKNQHKVAAAIREYAEKIAAEKAAAGEGAPDRMTVADGQGGITASKGTIPSDVGESELKVRQPANGTAVQTNGATSSPPDRLTVADGQGGITASKGSIPADPGEGELEVNQPADGAVVKGATISKRAASLRDALIKSSPEMAQRLAPAAKPAAAAAPATTEKRAAGNDAPPSIALSNETLIKIARVILGSDEGVRMTHDLLEKQAGEEAARKQILEAISASHVYDESEQVKQAALNDLGQKAVVIHNSLVQAGVTEADADAIIKQAAIHQEVISKLDHPLLKSAYAQGMDDAALMTAAEESEGEEGVPPVDEALPMGGESLGEEEIMALIQEMLASGQITEQDILDAVAQTSGAGAEGGGGRPAGMPPGGEEAALAGAGAGAPPMV